MWKNVVFKSWKDLPDNSHGYNNDKWAEKQKHHISKFFMEPRARVSDNKILIDLVEKFEKESVKILDIGGGSALAYFPLKAETDKKFSYHIVEVPKVIETSQEALSFGIKREVKFFESIPSSEKNYDIVHIKGCLQYLRDWKEILFKVCKLKPKYLVILNTTCGNIETFLTIQTLEGQETPHWFINEKEIVETCQKNGYFIESLSTKEISGDAGESYREAFPEEMRIDSMKNFIFTSKN